MTVAAVYGGVKWMEFATIRGTGDFSRWTEQLDTKTFPLLCHLADWGWVNDIDLLAEEIDKAIKTVKPGESLHKTLDEFKTQLVKYDAKYETVMLTQGMTGD